MWQKVSFWVEYSWFEFSVSPVSRPIAIPKQNSQVCPSILTIARKRGVFIHFPREFPQNEIQFHPGFELTASIYFNYCHYIIHISINFVTYLKINFSITQKIKLLPCPKYCPFPLFTCNIFLMFKIYKIFIIIFNTARQFKQNFLLNAWNFIKTIQTDLNPSSG